MLKRFVISLAVVSVLVGGLIFATKQFLKPMNTDLSVVGQGLPALVFAYENYSPESGAVLNQLNRIKSDYENRMVFAVADLGTPEGRAFAQRYELANGLAIFLSATGQPLEVAVLMSEEAALRKQLDAKLTLADTSRR